MEGGTMSRKLRMARNFLFLLLLLPVEAFGLASIGYFQGGVASSFGDIRLRPGAKLLIVLGNGETVRGGSANLGEQEQALTISTGDGLRILPEKEVYQVYQVRGQSRGRGAGYGALIGAAAAMATALLLNPTESDDSRFMFVGLVGIASVPSGAVIGALVSGEKKDLLYQNPAISRPFLSRALRNFSFNIATGANVIGGGPGQAAGRSHGGSSRSIAFQRIYRATPRWGLGEELLITQTGTWTWRNESDGFFQERSESREITAPGFNVYYFPVLGKHELYAVGGFSAFLRQANQSTHTVSHGRVTLHAFTETNLDYFLNGGLGYHYYFTRRLGAGGELQIYKGTNYPDPLIRFSASISLRN